MKLHVVYLRWTPHAVIVIIRGNKGYMRVIIIFQLYHYYRVGGPPKENLGLAAEAVPNEAIQAAFGAYLHFNDSDCENSQVLGHT